ncbi:11907_t:CDS:2 [Diversispora eburnea]|uniref:11907_t:CDS:1 n=1 Tax=Diversispora eburnea TaxID=1213867 RepID=A0A9N9A8C9_9GLOM|nr:11907_t:CDS:2 [Diversispora eburnea]
MKTNDDVEEYIVKIADFGLARDIEVKRPCTEYVSTRWYRAPEIILRSNTYSSPIDLWAAGAIMAELFTLKPLFPGKSEIDQLFKISEVLGSPCEQAELPVKIGEIYGGEWKEGIKLAKSLGFSFLRIPPKPLSKIFTSVTPPYFIEFVLQLLQYDPKRRLSSLDALKHPYFVESDLIFVPPYESEEIKGTRGMEKKRKKENFLSFRKGGNLMPGDKKKHNQYSWSKVFDEPCGTFPFNLLSPLDMEDVNEVREKDFKLPSIESNITEDLFVDSPTNISSSSLLTSNRNISASRGIFQFSTTVHKRNRSNTMSEVDRIAKEIEKINRDVESTNSNICYNNNKTADDFQRYQLPEDVMKFFNISDDSSPLIKRSYSKSKDFMKIHRRYSSTSAAFPGEISPLSSPTVDFQIHQKKPSIASSQDHYRNDSGSNDGGGSSLRREKLNNINENCKVKPVMTTKRSFIFDVTKGGGRLFSSSSSSKESPKEPSISKLRSSSNGDGNDGSSQRLEKLNENIKGKPAMTKKRSFIFDVTKGGLFSSSKEPSISKLQSIKSPKEEDSSNDPKKSNFKKERKHTNSSGLFSTLGAKISLH